MRKSLFARLQSFVYAGAALPPYVREEFERLGRETVGHVVPMLTSLGSTETGPSALSVTEQRPRAGRRRHPQSRRRTEARPQRRQARGAAEKPEHHAGLLAPAGADARRRSTRRAITSSATRCSFADQSDPERGFVFDGRVAEDFKLATGTWVSVGPLRLKFIAHCAPYVTDVVVAGHDRDDAAALVVPNLAACRELAGLGDGASAAEILAHASACGRNSPACSRAFNKAAGGSSGRFARLILMDDPPSLDTGEMTDKGSINQRAVLRIGPRWSRSFMPATPSRANAFARREL